MDLLVLKPNWHRGWSRVVTVGSDPLTPGSRLFCSGQNLIQKLKELPTGKYWENPFKPCACPAIYGNYLNLAVASVGVCAGYDMWTGRRRIYIR